MEVCVERSGFGVINLGITMQDDDDDETINSIASVVTGEITITKVTAEPVEEGIGEVE